MVCLCYGVKERVRGKSRRPETYHPMMKFWVSGRLSRRRLSIFVVKPILDEDGSTPIDVQGVYSVEECLIYIAAMEIWGLSPRTPESCSS